MVCLLCGLGCSCGDRTAPATAPAAAPATEPSASPELAPSAAAAPDTPAAFVVVTGARTFFVPVDAAWEPLVSSGWWILDPTP